MASRSQDTGTFSAAAGGVGGAEHRAPTGLPTKHARTRGRGGERASSPYPTRPAPRAADEQWWRGRKISGRPRSGKGTRTRKGKRKVSSGTRCARPRAEDARLVSRAEDMRRFPRGRASRAAAALAWQSAERRGAARTGRTCHVGSYRHGSTPGRGQTPRSKAVFRQRQRVRASTYVAGNPPSAEVSPIDKWCDLCHSRAKPPGRREIRPPGRVSGDPPGQGRSWGQGSGGGTS